MVSTKFHANTVFRVAEMLLTIEDRRVDRQTFDVDRLSVVLHRKYLQNFMQIRLLV